MRGALASYSPPFLPPMHTRTYIFIHICIHIHTHVHTVHKFIWKNKKHALLAIPLTFVN